MVTSIDNFNLIPFFQNKKDPTKYIESLISPIYKKPKYEAQIAEFYFYY